MNVMSTNAWVATNGGSERRRQRLERRYLQEYLEYEHESVEIERRHRGGDVDPAPRSRETTGVQRDQRDGEQYKRDGADDVRRQDARIISTS
jgi:hypothetical protein